MKALAQARVRAAAGWLMALAAVLPPGAGGAGDSCSGPNPAIAAVRFAADRWVDEAGLRKIAGLEGDVEWGSERAAAVRDALMQTQVFRSVETRLEEGESGCALVIELVGKPTVAQVRLSGASASRLAPLRGVWNWLTRNREIAPLPSEREVLRLMPLRSGSVFDPEDLDRGTKRILTRYQAAGYQSASVSSRYREEASAVDVVVDVQPGRPLLVSQLRVKVAPDAARPLVEEVLDKKLGRPRLRGLERDTRREVSRRLREEGYFDSHVEVHWRTLDVTDGQLRVNVDAGVQRAIEVVGNESVDADELIPRQRLYDRVIITNNTWRKIAASMKEEYQRRGFYEAAVELDKAAKDSIVYRVKEGRRFKIGELRIEGNETIEAAALRRSVLTSDRGWLAAFRPPRLVDDVLDEDVERIVDHYGRAGFESATVGKRVDLDRDKGTAVVTFTVREGARSMIRSVEVDPAIAVILDEKPVAKVGAPLDVVGLQEERQRVLSRLRGEGYLEAKADFAIQRQPAGDEVDAQVSWNVTRGPLHRVGDIRVQGNSEVQYVVVTRELPFAPGDTIDSQALLDAQQKVYEAGVFRNVSIAPQPLDEAATTGASDAGVDEIEREVAVRVAARAPGRFGYGVGYETRQGLTAFGELSYANLNHRAQRLRLRTQVGVDPTDAAEPTQYLVTAGFTEPSLFDGPWDWQLNGLAERNTRDIDQYNIERTSVATGSSRELADRFRVGADLQVEFARVFDVEPAPFRARDEQDAWTTAVSPFVVFDGRDSKFNPRAGFFESLRLRYVMPVVSQNDLIELTGQHTHLIPLWRDWGFVYSLRVGWVHSLQDNPIVPIRQRYFVGGGESVRGFAVNSLGPYDGDGNEIGGDLAIIAKTELRIPLVWGLGLVVFVDGGGNYLIRCDAQCRAGDPDDPATTIRDGALSFDNFRTAAGLGLRYVTPIGPISVDYGVKLDRRTRSLIDDNVDRESFGEFSVSVGARF